MHQQLKLGMFVLILGGLITAPMTSRAGQGDDGTAEFTLGEVIISADKPAVEAAGTVEEVTAADIEASGARTLNEAIDLLPGVNIRVGGDGVPRIDIRGLKTRHVVLLLDGAPFNSTFDQQFDPTLIPVENIARIKVTKGPSSVLYGQGGIGGVINIITKKGTKKTSAMAGLEIGDHEPYRVKGSVGGSAGKFDVFVSGSATRQNSFPLSDDVSPTSIQPKDYRVNSDGQRNNVSANVGYSPTDDLSLALTLSYQRGDYGKPPSMITDPFDPYASSAKYVRVNNFEGYSAQLAADYQVTKPFSIRSWLYFNKMDEQETQYDNQFMNSTNLVKGSYDYEYKTDIIGFTLQPKYELGKAGTVTLSLSTEKDSWKSSGLSTKKTNTFEYDSIKKDVTLYSAAAEYEVSPLPDFGLTIGYGHHWQDKDEGNENGWSLLTSAYYDVTESTRLKAAFQRNIRFASIKQLYDGSSGDPLLKPEKAYLFQVGVEQQLPGKTKLGLTGFHTTAKNLIAKDDALNVNKNFSEVRYQGIELSAETRIVPRLLARASYTYLDSKDKSTPGHDEYQYTPAQKVTLEGKYDFDFGLTPYIAFTYVGDQYTYTKTGVFPVQKMELDDFALVNVKLTQKLMKNTCSLYIGVDNLFDENYETSYGYPQRGRFLYGGVEFRL
ncbi:MAG: TonB-dependent receptor [Geobacteraceae bacterium]|nr:TonB-dependent receptor [Geobacteraceae bacterium]